MHEGRLKKDTLQLTRISKNSFKNECYKYDYAFFDFGPKPKNTSKIF